MHVLLIADGRSPHTVGWLQGMQSLGLTTTVLSSRLLEPGDYATLAAIVGPDRLHQPTDLWNRCRPLLLSGARRTRWGRASYGALRASQSPRSNGRTLESRVELYSARRLAARLKTLVRHIRPDALHALRVQYEGIAAARAAASVPLAISTWGQDLVTTAAGIPVLVAASRRALARSDVLITDCRRDLELAPQWGLQPSVPTFVLPGNFGVDLHRRPDRGPDLRSILGPHSPPLVVYPRGIRQHVNHVGFLRAARQLLGCEPSVTFVGVGLAGGSVVEAEVPGRLILTPYLDREAMLTVESSCAVMVSPSFSDGIPNSLLEGMAAGAIPVSGRVDSLAELEQNGAVIVWCDAADEASIADGIRQALRLASDAANRNRNRSVIAQNYSVAAVRPTAADAYHCLGQVQRTSGVRS